MKIRYLLTKLTLIVLLFSLFLITGAKAQKIGSPLVINYTSADFKATPEVYSVVQNKSGMLYFGHLGRIIEYDGVNWRHISLPTDQPVLSLTTDSLGTIYATCGSEFGLLYPTVSGRLEYYSLSSAFDINDPYVEGVGKTFVASGNIYFQTSKSLVVFSPQQIKSNLQGILTRSKPTGTPTIIAAESQFTNSYVLENEKVFVHQTDKGLAMLDNGTFEPFVKGGKFVDRKTLAILPFKRKQMVVATEKGIFYYTPDKGFGRFSSEAQDFYDQIEILHAIALPDAYVFSTLNGGTFVVEKNSDDKKRKKIEEYNKQAGLTTEQITSIYNNQDIDDRVLWLTSQYGIARTKINSPVRKINEANTVKDVILDITSFNKKIYVRTLGEIYYLSDTIEHPQFVSIKNIVSNNDWMTMSMEVEVQREIEPLLKIMRRRKPKYETVKEIQDRMMVASDNGLQIVEDSEARDIRYQYVTTTANKLMPTSGKYQPNYDIHKAIASRTHKGRIYLGMDNGFAIVSYQNGNWIDEGRREGIDSAKIKGIAEDAQGNIWLSVKNNGVYKLTYKGEQAEEFIAKATATDTVRYHFTPQDFEITKFGRKNGLPKMLPNGLFYSQTLANTPSKGLLFLTNQGIFYFDHAKQSFVRDNTFTNDEEETVKVFAIVEDAAHKFWLRVQGEYQTRIELYEKGNDGKYALNSKGFKLLPDMTTQAIYPDSAGLVWISGTAGLYSYATSSETAQKPYATFIRKVFAGKDSVLFWGASYNDQMQLTYSQSAAADLDYRLNNLRFEFAAPFFEDEASTKYSYKLNGFDADWSDWSNESKKEYTNLPRRSYEFCVKAKNVYGQESEQAIYKFTILTPWHETMWFQALEVVFFILLIFISVLLNRTGRSSRLTQILTMIAVVSIFKLLGALILGPFIVMFSFGITFIKIILDIAIGALLLPIWTMTMRLIQHGSIKEKPTQK